MTNRTEIPNLRSISCSGCGTVFSCSLGETCWCMDESVRLPMPAAAVSGDQDESQDCLCQDCLCRDCLRKIADQRAMAT
jgi:hypothetical protein